MVTVDDIRRRREHGEVVNDRHSRLTQFSSCFANSRAVDDGDMSARLKRKSKIADIKLRACPADQHAIGYEDTQSAHQTFRHSLKRSSASGHPGSFVEVDTGSTGAT